ncbi:winged helix-turn-helix domain-containing protein [Conexibacter arvalis]|uniref:DNA-binding transcriptional ArsR family regulator n=1 Tax=Conexibacter arvalis TaxID=912552 RepID=A0A840I907_9ACTN|nr:helix-turn-helix domain-containing protein [Conexibacter arvalis]MBB4660751.1 DNA-binding transcriptional ArsR family regulator [Conexibacter arvalis]
MLDIEVIEDPAVAAVALDPIRARLLAQLAEPASAAALAQRVGLTRQKVNYHLRTLESHGLVEVAGERRHGGLTERLLVASAATYAVSPGALGSAGADDPARAADRLSAAYLVALAGRAVREVGALARRARRGDRRLATLALDTEVRFRSAADRAAFADELTRAVAALVSKYHDGAVADGRSYRLLVAAHPVPAEDGPSREGPAVGATFAAAQTNAAAQPDPAPDPQTEEPR